MRRRAFCLSLVGLALEAACARPSTPPTPASPTSLPPAATPTAPAREARAPTEPPPPTARPLDTLPAPGTTLTQGPYPAASASARPVASAGRVPRLEAVAGGLEVPWALAFAPDGRIFLTERPGRLRLIEGGKLRTQPLSHTLPITSTGEGGLMGLCLDPAFAQNGYCYVMYSYRQGSLYNRVSRLKLTPDAATEEKVLLDGLPGNTYHNGGRLKVGPDGTLYATSGDAGQPNRAQALDYLGGKIHRLNLDGSIPADNPFPGSTIYSYGHRNPEGLAWRKDGLLYETEHGPSGEFGLCCRDEVNRIVKGGNYGWPLVTLPASDPRFIDPILDSGPTNTWAPAGCAFIEGEQLAPWRGNLLFSTLRGTHLHRIALDPADPSRVAEDEVLLLGNYGRLREAILGPDGALYLTTSNRDGRGVPGAEDDRVLRVVALD